MGRIFCLMGKSASGKDTIYNELINDETLNLCKIVSYTTRPIREKEVDGVQYHFTSVERFRELESQGKVIESRGYDTVHGMWYYYTVDDGEIDLSSNDYLIIATLESVEAFRGYFGEDNVVAIYIELGDGIRLQRALDREKKQAQPKYEEMCRRFLADAKDFAEDRLKSAGIAIRIDNRLLSRCIDSIRELIHGYQS